MGHVVEGGGEDGDNGESWGNAIQGGGGVESATIRERWLGGHRGNYEVFGFVSP